MTRIFLALWPDRQTVAAIEQVANAMSWPTTRHRYKPEDYHLTLHFIGEVAEDRLQAIEYSLEVDFEPFNITLDALRVWSSTIVVLVPEQIPPELSQLNDRLASRLAKAKLPVSGHAFSPHVTLARHAPHMLLPMTVMPITWRISGYALMASTGDPAVRYKLLAQYSAIAH